MPTRPGFQALAPLFLVSLAAVGFEILLTRYFAIANWSEYGYWVISITMVGFAVSGVVLSLFKDQLLAVGPAILLATPALLMLTAAGGFHFVTVNPFNPLELQHTQLWLGQVLNIGKYYLALFPFFFLTGLYIGVYFLTHHAHIPGVYAADLAGAGTGALLILLAMVALHPFYLLAAILPGLAAVNLLFVPAPLRRHRRAAAVTAVVVLVAAEGLTVFYNQAEFNKYKSIYPVLHVAGNRVVEEVRSPRGYFLVLDNFTERLDTDVSNNLGLLGVGGPPRTYGLYRDGNRITSLPLPGPHDRSYVTATLAAAPYRLVEAPDTLLIGTRGGFRPGEALALGARRVTALEPDATLHDLIAAPRYAAAHPALSDPRVRLLGLSPAELTARTGERFDLVDITSDFLDQSFANKYAFTVEAIQAYQGLLTPGGVISLPVSIREFTVYALKLLETARQALAELGVSEPARHILVVRSAWNVRILVSRRPFTADQVQRLRDFAGRRSFDVSYFPGIDPATVEIWNDLPRVSFETAQQLSGGQGPSDALMEQSLALFASEGRSLGEEPFFRLHPSSYDRPFFYNILNLAHLGTILERIAIVPREEIGYLVNVAVLLQSVLLAVVVLFLPLIRWRKRLPGAAVIGRSVVYFAALGIGFLFLEILLIEKGAYFLNDATSAFAVVLAGMLICSGIGSYWAGRHLHRPARAVRWAVAFVAAWVVAALAGLDPLLFALVGLPFVAKCAVLVALIAPVSVALGLPFPLGLYYFGGERSNFLPWAWSLNGAFSVISTPLANLVAVAWGYDLVLLLAGLFYLLVWFMYPQGGGREARP